MARRGKIETLIPTTKSNSALAPGGAKPQSLRSNGWRAEKVPEKGEGLSLSLHQNRVSLESKNQQKTTGGKEREEKKEEWGAKCGEVQHGFPLLEETTGPVCKGVRPITRGDPRASFMIIGKRGP